MHDSKSPSPGFAGASGLEARIDRIRQSMAAQQARLAKASMLTASIGAILCAVMAFWFYYGYVKIQEVMTPQIIVQAAESKVMDSLPSARAALESKINDSADEWAADISKQVQGNVPDVRRQLEEIIVAKSSQAMEEFQVLSANQFRAFVKANQSMLADGFRSLKKQDEADRFIQDLHSAVEQQLSSDMRTQAEDMLHTLIDLNAKLDALSKGERINHEQALEREILMIARRLQIETQANEPEQTDKPVAKRRPRRTASSTAATIADASADASADTAKDQSTPADEEPKAKEPKENPGGGGDSSAK